MTGFNINAFRSKGLTLGGARPSLFEVRINDLARLTGLSTSIDKLQFLATATTLPSSDLQMIEVPYFGRRIKLNGEREYRDWNITIMNDEDFILRDLFENWSNMIDTGVTNVQNTPDATPLNYKSESTEVLQFGKNGPGDDSGVIRAYNFFGLWPLRITDIRLDWSQGNQIETFDVQFAYDFWLPEKIGQATPSYTGNEGAGASVGTATQTAA